MTEPLINDGDLVAYADGEGDAAMRREIDGLLEANADTRARVAMFRRSSQLLKEALSSPEYLSVPPKLARSVQRRASHSRERSWSRSGALAAATIAGLMIGAVTTHHLDTTQAPEPTHVTHILHEVAEYHAVFASEDEHLVEVPAARKAHIESWLGERVKLGFKVPDLTGRDLQFEGGRMFVIDGQPVAQLMYTGKRGQRIAICIVQNNGTSPSQVEQIEDDGYVVLGKSDGNHVFIVAGPSGEATLQPLARELPTLLSRS